MHALAVAKHVILLGEVNLFLHSLLSWSQPEVTFLFIWKTSLEVWVFQHLLLTFHLSIPAVAQVTFCFHASKFKINICILKCDKPVTHSVMWLLGFAPAVSGTSRWMGQLCHGLWQLKSLCSDFSSSCSSGPKSFKSNTTTVHCWGTAYPGRTGCNVLSPARHSYGFLCHMMVSRRVIVFRDLSFWKIRWCSRGGGRMVDSLTSLSSIHPSQLFVLQLGEPSCGSVWR